MTDNHIFNTDIIVIGSGPVGLFAIFQAGMLNMKCHVVEALDSIGGQCNALYPTKPIYDIPAHPEIRATDLINKLETQAKPFIPTYHLSQTVEEITQNETDKSWTVTTSKNNKITAKAIIIATGLGKFQPNKPLIKNLEQYEKSGAVKYSVSDESQFINKNVVIIGGGDSAIDWVLNLHNKTKKIYLVHRRAKFKAAPDSISKMETLAQSGKIELVIPYQIDNIVGEEGVLKEVIVKDLSENAKNLKANFLLLFFGLRTNIGSITNWGINLDKENHILVNNSTMQTNLHGVYAVGDIASYKNKLKLILTGFSEVAFACHNIYHLIYPNKFLHFEHSTTKKIPNV